MKMQCHDGNLCKIHTFCGSSLAYLPLNAGTKPCYFLAVNILSQCAWQASFPTWHGIEFIKRNNKNAGAGSNAVIFLTYGDTCAKISMNANHVL